MNNLDLKPNDCMEYYDAHEEALLYRWKIINEGVKPQWSQIVALRDITSISHRKSILWHHMRTGHRNLYDCG